MIKGVIRIYIGFKKYSNDNSLYNFDKNYRQKGYRYLCGVDEAGRGPLAGPVVAAAVILPENFFIEGLNDSKKLTEKQREFLYPQIIKGAVSYGIGQVDEDKIDEINILQATFKAMKIAVDQLDLIPDYLLIDGGDFPGFIDKGNSEMLAGEAVVKGDGKSASIAAASILAKVYRDHLLIEYAEKYPGYGFEKHKGYGTKFHRDRIAELGASPVHRRTFLKNILG